MVAGAGGTTEITSSRGRVRRGHGDRLITDVAYSDHLAGFKSARIARGICLDDQKRMSQSVTGDHWSLIKMFLPLFFFWVGYNSIDILEANVIIQISSHIDSPHQEAQRLDCILRAEELPQEKDYPSFYSLVSMETQEAADSTVRQHFFVDQGYTFEEITSLSFIDLNCNLSYDEQIELLNQVLYAEDDMVVMEQEVRIFFVELSIDPSIIGGEEVELGNQVELAALLHDMGDYKYTKLSVSFAASNFDEKESRNRFIADGRLYAQAASQCRYLWSLAGSI
ncbi:hypothetical protein ZIOFF_032238 [Zingiber officinale]|uniref:ERCC3/RAD25/XPB helicase C-terminal domain-containing protein n=1 Tax=Zingiber officinale TaxID=94328 RepID=A0A8J5GGE9_ZINOF|nr:hypothetical protein ZIOFF_032238 [Zingiber officinale]